MSTPQSKLTSYVVASSTAGIILFVLFVIRCYSPLTAFLFAGLGCAACLWALIERK